MTGRGGDAPALEGGRRGGHGHPRPTLRRDGWGSLNGSWEFAIDAEATWKRPAEVVFDRTILVPFAPETRASGVGETGFYTAVWYRRELLVPHLDEGERLVLHFGAVDHEATVWIDDAFVSSHEGGYTPFQVDVTDRVKGRRAVSVVVRAHDDPADLAKPRGKQDWKLQPHSIWYPRTTGIWQTVWWERLPSAHVASVRWSANLERWELSLEAHIGGDVRRRHRLRVRLTVGDTPVADDEYLVIGSEIHRRIALSDPGIDDSRNELFWSPQRPTLIDAEILLVTEDGVPVDRVVSYTALRSIAVRGDRVVLNGRDFRFHMVLDQGYWPDTGMTPPDDDALRRDVELARAMGFNCVRKHQKLEDPRYLYWADRLGLAVWVEMPSAYRFTTTSVERLARQWVEAIARDVNHPCVVAWVPFNESWGVPNLPDSAAERHYVKALYHLTKTLDPTRPVVGNDGWESVATDIIGIHDYDADTARLGQRYFAHDVLPRLLQREKPGGRAIVIDAPAVEHPIVLSEMGGLSLRGDDTTWGYTMCVDAADLERKYCRLLDVVRSLDVLAGFCYTQFADTFQETNGLLFADRTPKLPLARIAAATRPRHDVPPGESCQGVGDA